MPRTVRPSSSTHAAPTSPPRKQLVALLGAENLVVVTTRDRLGHPPHFRGGGFLGSRPTSSGRADRHDALGARRFGRGLSKQDEVVVEATGNAMGVVRVLSPYVARVIVANSLQVKAIAHAHVKTDRIDAGVLASLRAAGFLPEVWLPDADTERRRRLVAHRNQVARQPDRIKNAVHAILQAASYHAVPACRVRANFDQPGQELPDDERAAIDRHLRELDRLAEDVEFSTARSPRR